MDNNEINNNEKALETKENKSYFSYNMRITIYVVLFLISFISCLVAAKYSFEYNDALEVDYSENQNIDYKVYLKENEFYEEEYLGKNMLYVASLIDRIDVNLNYDFKIAKEINLDYEYKIVGNLVIKDSNNQKTFFTKEYVLKEPNKGKINKDEFNINENVEIDYGYYNSLANSFKTQFGVDTTSYLEVALVINKDSSKDIVPINDTSNVMISIPLSEKAIDIKFQSQDASIIRKAVADKKLEFNSAVFIVEVVLLIISVILIKRIIELLSLLSTKKSKYDSYLEKILKEFDRLIVETTTGINENKSHVIYVHKFEELLDVRDTLKVPIMYYNIVKHQKCYFYVKNNNDVYLLKLKASDMELDNDK